MTKMKIIKWSGNNYINSVLIEKIPYIFILILDPMILQSQISGVIKYVQDTNPDAVYLCHGIGPE